MPHGLREEHLEDICANCKLDPGKDAVVHVQNKKFYNIITCQHCDYKIIKAEPVESTTHFVDKLLLFHKR